MQYMDRHGWGGEQDNLPLDVEDAFDGNINGKCAEQYGHR